MEFNFRVYISHTWWTFIGCRGRSSLGTNKKGNTKRSRSIENEITAAAQRRKYLVHTRTSLRRRVQLDSPIGRFRSAFALSNNRGRFRRVQRAAKRSIIREPGRSRRPPLTGRAAAVMGRRSAARDPFARKRDRQRGKGN